VTLAPALARAGARVTMLQRSPSYIAASPSVGLRPWLGRLLPQRAAYRLRRLHSILGQQIFWAYCRRWPARATELLRGAVAKQIGWPVVEQHFTPRYRPWDQRLCVAPNGDVSSAIVAGTVTVVTDQIDRLLSDGIRLEALTPGVLVQRLFDATLGGCSLSLGIVDRCLGQLGDLINGCDCV
jgi:monooxygenase